MSCPCMQRMGLVQLAPVGEQHRPTSRNLQLPLQTTCDLCEIQSFPELTPRWWPAAASSGSQSNPQCAGPLQLCSLATIHNHPLCAALLHLLSSRTKQPQSDPYLLACCSFALGAMIFELATCTPLFGEPGDVSSNIQATLQGVSRRDLSLLQSTVG